MTAVMVIMAEMVVMLIIYVYVSMTVAMILRNHRVNAGGRDGDAKIADAALLSAAKMTRQIGLS